MTILPRFELVLGSDENDRLAGIADAEVIVGLAGDDRIAARAGDDVVFGGRGADVLFGHRGDDFLSGGAGHDRLLGGGGHDRIAGGAGDDFVAGGQGDDILSGGRGADRFFFDPSRNGEGDDVIRDFDLARDRIVLEAADVIAATPGIAELIVANGGDAAAVFAALDASDLWSLEAAGSDLLVVHPNGTIRLAGIDAGAVSSFSDLAGVVTVQGLGDVLTGLDVPGRPETIADVVAASGGTPDDDASDFDLLLSALELAELTGVLADPEAAFSVFAPTDAAFVSLAQRLGFEGDDEAAALDFIVGALTTLGGGDPVGPLTDVLTYHVVAGAFTFGELSADRTVSPLFADEDLLVRGDRIVDAEPDLSDARVVASDIQTGNGIIQVIDEVLLPFDL